MTFINCFEVPAGREEDFLELYERVNRYMRSRPGYISNCLHRSLQPDDRFRFVNVVRWETPEHWRAAHGEEFRSLVMRPEWAEFRSIPALYEVVSEYQVAEIAK